MTNSAQDKFCQDLGDHPALYHEAIMVAVCENQALAGQFEYSALQFTQKRKNLLPRLEQSLMALRKWRNRWQQGDLAEYVRCSEVKVLIQSVQSLLMKVLMLDRENQQALLQRGLLPARRLPSSAVQQHHCLADVCRRHSRS